MILVDRLFKLPHKRKWYAHMVSDVSLAELREFADRVGIKRHWFDRDHYDLREFEWETALEAGAHLVSPKILARRRAKA